jgi:hypothetical protein
MISVQDLAVLVETSPSSCYAIAWVLSESGQLKHHNHYAASEGFAAKQRQGARTVLAATVYTSEAARYTCTPGEGVVGKVFAAKHHLFVQDLEALSFEEASTVMFAGDTSAFKLSDMANKFNIRAAFWLPLATGVLEIGSTRAVWARGEILEDHVVADVVAGGYDQTQYVQCNATEAAFNAVWPRATDRLWDGS